MATLSVIHSGQALLDELLAAVLADIVALGGAGLAAWGLIRHLLAREWEHTYAKRLANYSSELSKALENHKADLETKLDEARHNLNRDLSAFGTRYSLFQSARFEVAREMYKLVSQPEGAIAAYTPVMALVPEGADDEADEAARFTVAQDAVGACRRYFIHQELLFDDDAATSLREFLDLCYDALQYRKLGTTYVKRGQESLSKLWASSIGEAGALRRPAEAATRQVDLGAGLVERAEEVSRKATEAKKTLKEDLRRIVVAPEA